MKKYTGKSEFEAGVGGSGSGAGGAGNLSSGRRGYAPLTKEQMRARDKANADVQRRLPRLPKKSRSYEEEMPEPELSFKKGGMAKKYASGGTTKPKPAPKPKDVPEDDAPPTGPDGKYLKPRPFKKGGNVKCMAKGGGCEVRGKTKGRMI